MKRRSHPIVCIAILLILAGGRLCFSSPASTRPVESPPFNIEEKSRWVHFSTSSGLPSGEVTGIFETTDSTLWVSTVTGVAWFDGFQWKSKEGSPDWPSRQLLCVSLECGDSVWVHAADTEFLGTRFGFRPIMKREPAGLALVGGDATPYRQPAAYYKWYDEHEGRELLPGFQKNVTQIFFCRDGSEWIELPQGLFQYTGAEGAKWKGWEPKMAGGPGELALRVAILRQNTNASGICVVGTPAVRSGLWEWTRGGRPTQSAFERQMPFILSADIDDHDNVVAVARSGETFVRHNGTWKILPFLSDISSKVTAVYFRRNGDLCVGASDGLYIWRSRFSTWEALPQSSVEFRNCVNELLMARSGDLWIGSADGVEVRSADGKTREVTSIDGKRILNITGMAEDKRGNIWISSGSSFDGAYEWTGNAWKWFAVSRYAGGVLFHKIRKDQDGHLWFLGLGHNIGTADDNGAGAYELIDGTFKRLGVPEGLPSGRVYAFCEGRDGALWFGTYKGISRLKNGTWRHWQSANGILLDHAFCLAEGSGGRLWFGQMKSTGMGYVDRQDSVHLLTMSDGLPDDRVFDMRVDSAGRLWATTLGGLCCYDHGEWSVYDERSGLPTSALWPVLPCGDSVYVGTIGRGVAILTNTSDRSPCPRIILHPPLVGNENVYVAWTSCAFYGEVSPENILSRYKLSGGSWSPWSTAHELSLHDLSPGTYNLSVQSKGLFGQFDPVPQQASFSVLPPLFLRPVVYVSGGAVAAMFLVMLVLFQVRRVRHRIAIAKSEERYRLITELMSDYAYLNKIAEDGTISIVWITDSFSRKTGYSVAEAAEKGFARRYVFGDDFELSQRIIADVVKGVPANREWRIVAKDGRIIWMHNYIAPIWDKVHQRVTHIYGIATDITNRKAAEQQLLANQSQLRSLAADLSMTEERERRRMATFLHDSIGQSLALAKLKLSLVQEIVRKLGERVAEGEVNEIRELVEHSIQDTRSLTFDLSPPVLHQLGFVASIEWLLNEMRNRHKMSFVFKDDGTQKTLDDEYGVFLFHAVREILHNVIKHASATEVVVALRMNGNVITVEVHDNGGGFDTNLLNPQVDYQGGYGLFNIRERTHHFGGHFGIESCQGGGTSITITMPVGKGAPVPDAEAFEAFSSIRQDTHSQNTK